VFLRSFAIQGSWNFETLVGYGFAFALLPALRVVYRGRPDDLAAAVGRHARLFNSHPYLAPIALGAVARLEVEGKPVDTIERFKAAVRGALGGLGDRLVWAGWRPVCILGSLGMLLAGVPWWIAVVAFLVVYNAGHVGLRVWAFRLGWKEGTRIAVSLRTSWIWDIEGVLRSLGPALLGACVVLLVAGTAPLLPRLPDAWIVLVVFATGIGLAAGARVRRPLEGLLVALVLVGFLWSAL
jgi:PTS system mannose-specific IID component